MESKENKINIKKKENKNKLIKFGTDGWRGIIAKEFTYDKVLFISQGISNYLKSLKNLKSSIPKVVIGYDTRFLSDIFAEGAAKVFSKNGIITEISQTFIPTPILSNAVVSRNADLGIMITASHNPYVYNGYKIKGPYGGSATMDIISDIESYVNSISYDEFISKDVKSINEDNDGKNEDIKNKNSYYIKSNFITDYLKKINELINTKLLNNINFKILIDSMYGAAQGIYSSILKSFNLNNVIEIHNIFNPAFGGINPEPVGKNILEATEFLKQNKIKIGICLDGDADRIGAIGEEGNFISSHHIFAIVLRDLIRNGKKASEVIKTVTTSSIIDRIVNKNNLSLKIKPVGFKYIAEEIVKGNVLMGGEESGGLWTNGNIPERDGMLMGLKLLEIVARENKSLNMILNEIYDEYGYFVYERNDYEMEIKERDKIKSLLELQIPPAIEKQKVKEVITIDGFKYVFDDDSWLMIRPSGTEAVVRVYAESSDEKRLKELLDIGKEICKGGKL